MSGSERLLFYRSAENWWREPIRWSRRGGGTVLLVVRDARDEDGDELLWDVIRVTRHNISWVLPISMRDFAPSDVVAAVKFGGDK